MHPILLATLRYILWIICCVFGVFLLIVFRASYLQIIVPMAASGWNARARAITLDQIFLVVAAIVFIVFLGLSEFYLRKGQDFHALLGRFARLLGVEIGGLFMLHASIAFNTGFSSGMLILLGTEFVIAMTAIGGSFQVLPPGTGRFSQRIHKIFKRW